MARKQLTGVVTSTKNDKTIIITVVSRETHPLYGKQFSVSRKYTAHDEKNEANLGDTVVITETRPISKTKRFELTEIQAKSKGSIEVRDDVVTAEKETA